MVRQIHPTDLAQLIAAGSKVVLVDVRQPWEHEVARLAGSVLIPLGELARRADEVERPEGAMVVAYCHHGVRSLSGAAMLEQAGLGEVYSLAGGIDAWSMLVDETIPRY